MLTATSITIVGVKRLKRELRQKGFDEQIIYLDTLVAFP
jgi:SOS response regulatory protein OraA/RecX